MPAPSNLEVATKSVQRLVKEEGYYRVEQSKGQKRVTDLKADIEKGGDGLDPNAEFVLKQEARFFLSRRLPRRTLPSPTPTPRDERRSGSGERLTGRARRVPWRRPRPSSPR